MALSLTQRWLVTGAATIVSTYALDVVATVAGIVLVASGLLHGSDKGVCCGSSQAATSYGGPGSA